MPDQIRCEFFLLRYVPDPVDNEFVNIGIILREAGREETTQVRLTRDWSRVLRLDPDADTDWLTALEPDLVGLFRDSDPATGSAMQMIEDSLSNALQVSERRASLASSIEAQLDRLMQMYVDSDQD